MSLLCTWTSRINNFYTIYLLKFIKYEKKKIIIYEYHIQKNYTFIYSFYSYSFNSTLVLLFNHNKIPELSLA